MSSTTTAPFRLKELFESSDDPASYAEAFGRNFASRLHELDYDAIGRFAEAVAEVQNANRCIYVIANGGSAAVASHFVNDMGVNSIVPGTRGFKILSLTENGEALTAVANDTG